MRSKFNNIAFIQREGVLGEILNKLQRPRIFFHLIRARTTLYILYIVVK